MVMLKGFVGLGLAAVGAAFDFSVEQRSIEVPRIGTDVNVTCGGKEIAITVSPQYIQRNSMWLRDGSFLSLNDPECGGEKDEDGNVVLKIRDDFTKCNMLVEEVTGTNGKNETYVSDYKFTNVLKHDASESAAIARELDLLEFNCVYPTEQITSNYMQPWIKTQALKTKVRSLKGDMRLFKNENYTDFYTAPPVLALDDVLYVEVNLERPLITDIAKNAELVVVMEKCWGTPVADRDNTMRYYMIQDACPVTGDTSLKVHSNGVSLQGRFDLKMFKFIGDDLNDVWLHCSVRACEATNAEDCIPQCGGNRKRRSTGSNNSKGLNYVSLEATLLADLPIQRLQAQTEEYEILERIIISKGSVTVLTPGTVSFNVMLCVVALISVLAVVFSITCMIARRKRDMMKALTESSNFSSQDLY